MELGFEFVATAAVDGLLSFLTRTGARHAFLVGPPGAGKTMALDYLAAHLRRENHAVILVQLASIESGAQLIVHIARALLETVSPMTGAVDPDGDALAQLRTKFQLEVTASQRLLDGPQLIDRIAFLIAERLGGSVRTFVFLDGLDEVHQVGDVALTIEQLAETMTSTSLVVASRAFLAADRLRHRSAFDTFNLVGLSASESTELIHRLLPKQPVPSSIVQQMVSRANGSPYVLTLLVSLFRDTGELGQPEDGYTINRLLDRVLARLGADQVGKDARILLNLLVILQPLSIQRLREISGLSDQRVQATIQKITALSFVGTSQTELLSAHPILTEYYIQSFIVQHDIDVTGLQFGDEAAERDLLFAANFVPPQDLHFITSGTRTVVLGDRGSGKSAVFRALQELSAAEAIVPLKTLIAASRDPAAFVQQMTTDDSATSSAEGFKAIWLLYSAALAARVVCPADGIDDADSRAFLKSARKLLRRIGWGEHIKGESRVSRWAAAIRSVLPEKVTLRLGPVTVEPNWARRGQGRGTDIRIDNFIDSTDRLLQLHRQRLLIVFDQIDEAFKYQRDKQEALIQGLFLAEAFLSV